jgi:hypothetical protein
MNLNLNLRYCRSGTIGSLWLLLFLVLFNHSASAQILGSTITLTPSDAISTGVTGNNTIGYSMSYVLVDAGGHVLASNTTGSFPAQVAGTYTLYAVNHDGSWTAPTSGAWISAAPTGTQCATYIDRLIQVQNCLPVCAGATLTAPTISSATLTGTYRLDYVLVCGSTYTSNTASADGGTGSTSFTAPATAQACALYAVNYDNSAGTPSYTAAANTLTVSGNTCYSLIDRCVTVNALPVITTAHTDATCAGPNTGSITISGLTASAIYTVAYTKDAGAATTLSGQVADASGNIVLSNLGAGSYTAITATNANGCVSNIETETIAAATGCVCTTICEGSAFGNQIVEDVNNDTGYSVALVLVCNNAIVGTVVDAADVGTPNSATGISQGTIPSLAPATPTTCSIWAINYQGTGLAAADITPTGTSNDITVNPAITCEEKIEKCYTINPLPTATATITPATCNGATANSNGTITLSGFAPTERYDFVQADTYTGTATYATATAIPVDGVITNTLANPAADTDYTVRIFTSDGCFIDRTVTLTPTVCSASCPTVAAVNGSATICSGDLAAEITTWQDAVAANATNAAAIADANTGAISYSSQLVDGTIVTAPNNIPA